MKPTFSRLSLALLLAMGAGTAQAQVVVSQVYGGGGNTGAPVKSDFIELHNNGASSVVVPAGGWSVQYASSTGSSWTRTDIPAGTTIPAGRYLLIREGQGAGAQTDPLAFDITGNIAMSGSAGKVALVNNQTTLTGTCPLGASVLDFVGFGPATNCSETAPTTPNLSNTTAAIRAGNGCTDTNNNSTDFANGAPAARNSASPAATCSGPSIPTLSINDVSQAESNVGTIIFNFTVSLSAPAGEGGVSFDIATADGTATAGSDYIASSLTGQVIAAGNDSYNFSVTVNGETAVEGNEGFLVSITNVVGATVGDASGLGTILNDDAAAAAIHDIQGSGTASAYDGESVVTTGVVTIKRGNGFYLQTPDASVDADPATSEGIFVFTGGASSVAVGDLVEVTGTVDEFLPVANTYPVTQLQPSNILVLSTSALPAPITLTAANFPGPLIDPDVLEHLEGMYVQVASGKIVAPTRSASTEFEVVLADVPRPVREAGISIFDPFVVPPTKVDMPYFDANQERIKLRPVSGATPLVDARGTVSGIHGALDYAGAASAVNSWQIWYDPAQGQIVSGAPQAVADASADDVTIAGFNLEWFFVTAEDGQSGTEAQRRTKIAAVVCDWLKTPDILATSEVDDLTSLQGLASEINAGCASAPEYEARMLDTDAGNQQRLGFLISKRVVTGETPRVELVEIEQHNETTLLQDPDGNPVTGEQLNDRPPLRLKTVLHFADGRQYPVTVIAVHQKSLIGVDSTAAGRNGYPTEGARNRAKRAQQAFELAELVHDLQTADPDEKIVLVGDFNSFDANDGYVDVMGITTGTPAPETAVIHWADSPLSVVNGGIPLIVGSELIDDVEERYSYIFNNIKQSLDHAVINQALLYDPLVNNIVVDHTRVNSDFRKSLKSVYHGSYNTTNQLPLASSDHDPVRVVIRLAADTAPPAISYTLSPAAANGSNGWYIGNVLVDWTLIDPETTITSSTGCNDATLSTDTAGATYTCSATSAGGTNSVTTPTIKRDATAPTLAPTVPSPLLRGQSYVAAPNASDATSGVASSSCGPLDTNTTGSKSTSCTATDNAGNVATVTLNYTVTTTCANDGYKGTQLTWCRNVCEMGYTGATLDTWIHRWVNRYRDLPYCLVNPQPNPQLTLQ